MCEFNVWLCFTAFVPDDCADYVEIIEMFTNTTVAKLCGATVPDPVSTRGPMQVVFKTDASKNYNGFIATYKVSGTVVTKLFSTCYLPENCLA